MGDGLHLSAYRTSRTKGVITLDRTSPFDVASDPAGVHPPQFVAKVKGDVCRVRLKSGPRDVSDVRAGVDEFQGAKIHYAAFDGPKTSTTGEGPADRPPGPHCGDDTTLREDLGVVEDRQGPAPPRPEGCRIFQWKTTHNHT